MKTKKLSIAAQLFLFIWGAAMVVAAIVGSIAYLNMGSFKKKKCKETNKIHLSCQDDASLGKMLPG